MLGLLTNNAVIMCCYGSWEQGRAIKPPKPEMKPIIDEFEGKLKEAKAKGDEVHETETKAISAVKRGGRKSGRKAGGSLAGLKVKGVRETRANDDAD